MRLLPSAKEGRIQVDDMAKRIEKTVVPSREERLEQMGDPKPPKMGGITPTTVEVPEVDDLLEKMGKIGPKNRKEFLGVPAPGAVDFRELWTKQDLGFKF